MRAAILEVLEEHRFSSSPWFCTCGEPLENSDIEGHRADAIVAVVVGS